MLWAMMILVLMQSELHKNRLESDNGKNGNLKCKQLQIAVLLYKVSLPPLGNQLPKMLWFGNIVVTTHQTAVCNTLRIKTRKTIIVQARRQ